MFISRALQRINAPKLALLLGVALLLLLAVPTAHSGPDDTGVSCTIPLMAVCEVSDPDGLARITVELDTTLGVVTVVDELFDGCPTTGEVSWDPIVPHGEITVYTCTTAAEATHVYADGSTFWAPTGDATLHLRASDLFASVPAGGSGGMRTTLGDADLIEAHLDGLDERGVYELQITNEDDTSAACRLGGACRDSVLLLSARVGAERTTLLLDATGLSPEAVEIRVYDGERMVDGATVDGVRVAPEILAPLAELAFGATPAQAGESCLGPGSAVCCLESDGMKLCPWLRAPSRPEIDLDGDGVGVTGDLVLFRPVNPSGEVKWFNARKGYGFITTTGDDAFSLDKFATGWPPFVAHGLFHTPLGEAEVEAFHDTRLSVSDLGRAGGGVRIGADEWKYIPIRRYGATLLFPPVDGGRLVISAFGPYGDSPSSSLIAEIDGDMISLVPQIERETYLVQYVLDGEVVHETDGLSTEEEPLVVMPVADACNNMATYAASCYFQAGCWDHEGENYCWYLPERKTFNPPGAGALEADEVRLIEVGGDGRRMLMDHVELQTTGIPYVTLLDEEAVLMRPAFLPLIHAPSGGN